MQTTNLGPATGGRDGYLPALDGLRFMAAMLVAGGHYLGLFVPNLYPDAVGAMAGLGMTLFFVLSGFVIHYNYHATLRTPGGVRVFLAARFARLYPLYIILFLLEFAYLLGSARSACARAGDFAGQFNALLNYLTLTQSWVYTVDCDKALIYQYGPVSAVTWSISVEMFFYLAYAAGARILAGRHVTRAGVIGGAVSVYAATTLYYWLCGDYQTEIDRFALTTFGRVASTATDYNDSLLRWLLYFSPLARLSEFCAGTVAAIAFLQYRRHDGGKPALLASATSFAAIAFVLGAHVALYSGVAAVHPFIGKIASPLYAPLVALMIFCVARDVTPWSRLLSSRLLVMFGEASYSIYLLHEVFPSAYKRLGIEATTAIGGWSLWIATLAMLAIVSRASYLTVEDPARRAVRRALAAKVPKKI